MQDDSTQDHPKKKIYILPNLITMAALFGGFYAIVMSMGTVGDGSGHFIKAAIGIFFAMIFDGLDGRVARLTRTSSDFGEQLDSLSDMVSFGAAPALVIYMWGLQYMGKFGWIVAFIFCACAALRLARFNTNIGIVDKRFFQGLPSPAAAAIVASFVWVMADYDVSGGSGVMACLITLFAGLSMVSNIPFYSFKVVNFRESVSFSKVLSVLLPFVLILFLFFYKPAQTLLLIFLGYGVSGYVYYLVNILKGKKVTAVSASEEEQEVSDMPDGEGKTPTESEQHEEQEA